MIIQEKPMKQQPKDTRVGLTDDNITKIREWLISQGKNPDKKKSEFIRFLIDSFNSDKVYFNHNEINQNKFTNNIPYIINLTLDE